MPSCHFRHRTRAARAFSGSVGCHIHGDTIEPGGESGFAPEAAESAESSHESVLNAILSLFTGAGDAQGEVVDLGSIEVYQAVKGLSVALLSPRDQSADMFQIGLFELNWTIFDRPAHTRIIMCTEALSNM